MSSKIPPLVGNPAYPGVYRVVIHGNSGTGKSTLSKRLAQILNVPVIHLDEIHWRPGWKEASSEEMVKELNHRFKQANRTNTGWVMDGNYETKVKRLADNAATDIIWLDPPFWNYFPRAVLRTFRRLFGYQETCAPGCRESWREVFSSNSILLWVWTHHKTAKERYRPRCEGDNITIGGKWRRLGDIDEHEKWLDEVEAFVSKSRDLD